MKKTVLSLCLLVFSLSGFAQLSDYDCFEDLEGSKVLVSSDLNQGSSFDISEKVCQKYYETSNSSAVGYQESLVRRNFKSEAKAYCSTCGGVNWSATNATISIEKKKSGHSIHYTKAKGTIKCNGN